MAGVHERNTYEEIGIRSDNGKIVINGGSVTVSGGNKAITTKEEEASAGNNDITTVKTPSPVPAGRTWKGLLVKHNPVPKTGDSANPVLWLGLILLGLAGISGLAVSKVRK